MSRNFGKVNSISPTRPRENVAQTHTAKPYRQAGAAVKTSYVHWLMPMLEA
jgi:hypothetical protein